MIDCVIIQDLLPLYVDDVVSPESKAIISEHIATCESCKKELEKMENGAKILDLKIDSAEIGALKKMKKKIFRRMVIVAVIAGLMALALTGAYLMQDIPISYSDANITQVELSTTSVVGEVYDENGIFIREYEPEIIPIIAVTSTSSLNMNGSGMVSRDITINGETVRIIYFQLFRPRGSRRSDLNSEWLSEIWLVDRVPELRVGTSFDRAEIYYTAVSFRSLNAMSDDDFLTHRSSANLLWSGTP